MQYSATTPAVTREHEKPMSWARAIVIATGFFFATAILLGQLPSYFFTISTLSTLARFEQGTLDLGLLAVGFGLLALEIVLLYDPKPLLPPAIFGLVGLALAAVGAVVVYQVSVGLGGSSIVPGQSSGWGEFVPTTLRASSGAVTGYWPTTGSYLFQPAWFQSGAIDLSAIGTIGLLIGLGMFSFAALNPLVLSGKLSGPLRDLLLRVSLGLSMVILALYFSLLTFVGPAVNGSASNILLFLAVAAAFFALQVWLLPVMVANRARFMPGVYLHGVVGLLGNVGVPLLALFVLVYPVVNLIHSADSTQFWVQCSQKNDIPGSCTFTPFTGYIICAIVFSIPFGLLMAGLYFWSTRRDMVVLGGTFGLLYLGIAALVIHMDDPVQLSIGLVLAASIAILAYFWTWGTQREFAPTQAQQLGCVGQWLVLGTLLLFYLAGFALFSAPNFFESEALGLFYVPGRGGLHDAFWGVLLMLGLAGLQMTFLISRRPLSNLRKFALWVMLTAVLLEMIGAIQGFHRDVLVLGVNAMEGSHAIFLAGICFEVVGVAASLIGAFNAGSIRWGLIIGIVALVALAFGVVIYNLPTPYPELIIMAFIGAMAGAFAYTAAGPDYAGERVFGADAHATSPFVVSR